MYGQVQPGSPSRSFEYEVRPIHQEPARIIHSPESQPQDRRILRSIILSDDAFIKWRIIISGWCLMLVFRSLFIADGIEYFEYLTQWSLTISTMYLVLAGILTIGHIQHPGSNSIVFDDNSVQFCHTLQHISATISTTVAISYWYFLHAEVTFASVNHHGVVAILNVIDVLLSSNELEFSSTIHKPLIFITIYFLFSVLLGLVFSIQVYSVLDWEDAPGSTALNGIMCLVLIMLIHWSLCTVKKRILKCHQSRNHAVQRMQGSDADSFELEHAFDEPIEMQRVVQ